MKMKAVCFSQTYYGLWWVSRKVVMVYAGAVPHFNHSLGRAFSFGLDQLPIAFLANFTLRILVVMSHWNLLAYCTLHHWYNIITHGSHSHLLHPYPLTLSGMPLVHLVVMILHKTLRPPNDSWKEILRFVGTLCWCDPGLQHHSHYIITMTTIASQLTPSGRGCVMTPWSVIVLPGMACTILLWFLSSSLPGTLQVQDQYSMIQGSI